MPPLSSTKVNAPEKAPATCPNISDSRSVSGIAALLIETISRLLRRLFWWMN